MRHRFSVSVVALTCAVTFVASGGRHTTVVPRTRVPEALRRTTMRGQSCVHVFLRDGCAACEQHLRQLDAALASLPDSLRRNLRRRILLWEVGSTGRSAQRRRLPLAAATLGIRATPVTWFVAPCDSILRRWIGARSRRAWQHALLLLEQESP